MAYTLEEIKSEFEWFAQEYITCYAHRDLILSAYRNEYCCDSNVAHFLANTPRYEATKKILSVLQFDQTKELIWLNTTKTHAVKFSDVFRFYNETLSGFYEPEIDEDCYE